MVRMRASAIIYDEKLVPPAVAIKDRARGRAKDPTRGHTVAARYRAPTRFQECTTAISVEPLADQVEDQLIDDHVEAPVLA